MGESASLHAFVFGRVQGTFFRAYAKKRADELGLTGYARNMPDGSVEVMAEGDKKTLERMISYLNVGPPAAKVEKIVTKWGDEVGRYSDFQIKY